MSRVDEIEIMVSGQLLTAPQVFTQMKQLIPRKEACGEWYRELISSEKEVFDELSEEFKIAKPEEYLNAVDFILDVHRPF